MSLKKIIIARSAEKFQSSWGHIHLETSVVALSSSVAVTTPAQKTGDRDSGSSPRVKLCWSKGYFSLMNSKIKGQKKEEGAWLWSSESGSRVLLLWFCSRSYFCVTNAVTSHVKLKFSSSFPKCMVAFIFLCHRHERNCLKNWSPDYASWISLITSLHFNNPLWAKPSAVSFWARKSHLSITHSNSQRKSTTCFNISNDFLHPK